MTHRAKHARDWMPEPLNYDIPQFCRATNISRSKVYELLAAGKIKSIQIGRKRLVPREEAVRLSNEGAA